MNFFRQILVFILAWLIIPALMIVFNIPFKNLLLIVAPIIFSLYNFIKGLIEKNSILSIRYFLIATLFVLLGIKIEYHFYNWFIHLIFIIVGSYYFYTYKNFKVKKINALGRTLIFVNIILLVTPNSLVLDLMNHEKKPWSEQLDWNDFKGDPKEESELDAIISKGVHYKINKAYNYPNAVISAYMDRNESWVKDISDAQVKNELLNHEKGHFNILEAHIRFTQDSLQKIWGSDSNEIENTINYFLNQEEIIQDEYDSITKHGSILGKQREWDNLIEKWLN